MASTYTTRLRFEKQGTGENDNTWGTRMNTVLDLLDEALDGYLAKSVAGSSNVTLSTNNSAADETRQKALKFTGTLTGNIEVSAAAVEKMYVVWNATAGAFSLTFQPAGGTGIVIPQGYIGVVFTDGSTMYQAGPWISDAGVINANSQKVVNLTTATARTDAANLGNVQDGGGTWYATATGTNTITATLSPAITAYVTGQAYPIKIANTNTGATTVNLNSIGAVNVHTVAGTACAGGELIEDSIAWLVYDGTQMVIANWGAATFASNAAQAAILAGLVGHVEMYMGSSAPDGWLILNGDTMGSAASSADQASDDYEALFELMWDSIGDSEAPVSSGRGASAAADWAANKTITLLDGRGRVVLGTGTGSGLTARTHGDTGGAQTDTSGSPSSTQTVEGGGGQNPASGNHSHQVDIMQPWLALNFIVKW